MNILSYLFLISLIFASAQQCSKQDIPDGTPACVQAKIDAIRADDVWNPPAKVYRYTYNGEKVFYITSRCCDIPSQLYDEDCNLICHPDGGYTGKGDNRCPDFADIRKSERLIWEDKRAAQ